MKFRGTITVDFDAERYSEAGDKEKILEEFTEKLREQFPDVTLLVTDRRERATSKKDAPAPRRKKAAAA